MEKLKKVEAENAVKTERANRSLAEGLFVVTYKSIDIMNRHYTNLREANEWLFLSDFVLFFGLLADLGIFKNIETPPDIQSSF